MCAGLQIHRRMVTEPLAVNGAPEGPDAGACKALGQVLV